MKIRSATAESLAGVLRFVRDYLWWCLVVIARHEVPKQSLKAMVRLLHGACPERHRTLRGVYPERDSSVASLPQNDKRRRARNDNLSCQTLSIRGC